MDPETVTGNTERHTTGASESIGQSRPKKEANPQAPSTASGGTLSGPLQQLSHVQWEQANDASPVDNSPLVASMSSEAFREALTSFGAGASADMDRKPRQSQAGDAGSKPLVLVNHHHMLAHRASNAPQRHRARAQRSFLGYTLWYERGRHATKTQSILGT